MMVQSENMGHFTKFQQGKKKLNPAEHQHRIQALQIQ